MKRIKIILAILALFTSATSNADVVTTSSRSGTYFYDEANDCGGCFANGKCLEVVVTPSKVQTIGDVTGDYTITAVPGEGPFILLIFYEPDVPTEYEVISYDQVSQSDGSVRFTYQLYE